MRKIDKIIVHCSDSPHAHHDDISVIDKWHKDRGFAKVGYHYFVKSDGTVQTGRKESEIGAHCVGQNTSSIGICLHGRKHFTQAQFEALRLLVQVIKARYQIKIITGHYTYSSKTCPNFNVEQLNL